MLSLINASIIDPETGSVFPDKTILVEGERITEVSDDKKALQSTLQLDLKGKFVLPGLCDAHVHVTASTANFPALANLAPSYVTAQSQKLLRDMLLRGFTTVRDAGGADHGLARALEERLFIGPRLLFCEKALSQTGGHGDVRLPGESMLDNSACRCGLGHIADGTVEVRRACREFIRKGVTHIKLMVSGGVLSPTDRITSTQFAIDELHAAVEEADAAGIYCMAHAYTPSAIQRAVNAGVRSIEHGNLLNKDVAILMRQRNSYLVPTLATYDALSREGVKAGLSSQMISKVGEVLDAGRAALEIAANEGVQIAFGTDLLGDMHSHQSTEFSIRSEIQSPLAIIQSATVIAARLFGMAGQIGIIAPGAYADILVFDRNPLDDINLLVLANRSLRLILQRGSVISNSL